MQKNISLQENIDAPMTKAVAKVNVCHAEEKKISLLMQRRESR